MVSTLKGLKILFDVARKTGCTGREMCVLVILSAQGETKELRKRIRALTGMKRSNLSALLKKMEKEGLVKRDVDGLLTEEGWNRVFEIADYYLAFRHEEKGNFYY